MKIILYQPQIPQNTGNIARTCAVTGCQLVLVRPLGFSITDRWLKRAGLDYWEGVDVEEIEEEELWQQLKQAPAAVHLLTSKAKKTYTTVSYGKEDWFLFGSETAGLPQSLTQGHPEWCVTIPMKQGARCLNLATSVGIVIYEAWRQQKFAL